mmetsp:Transcript_11730/g.32491  ORF Transcript_11730/g.32491 Transcript_11730/m.32491 type:complete len:426 (-) Transcript_11730:254-1531(-)
MNNSDHDDVGNSSSTYKWEESSAQSMADCIHHEVRQMVASSRLVRKTENVALVSREELDFGALLGKGAFSEVHEVCVRKDRTRKRYAMKHLKHKLMSQPDNFRLAAAELAVEAHMLASFDHPNILKIQGWAANGVASFVEGSHDSFFLLLDCLDETLDSRIAKWKQNEDYLKQCLTASPSSVFDAWKYAMVTADDTASVSSAGLDATVLQQLHQIQLDKLKVCGEIASALSYLHDCGVIFRDLKPNNIGILNGTVKLFDFGLSRELPGCDLVEPFEMSGKVGTLRYMAVEVASHQRYNVSADVYSWAMVCYEVMTGEKPFAGWTREMHADLVCARGMRPETDGLDTNLRLMLHTCWDQNPLARPSMPAAYQQVRFMEEQQLIVCMRNKQQQQHVSAVQQQQAAAVQLQQQQNFLHQQQQQQQECV